MVKIFGDYTYIELHEASDSGICVEMVIFQRCFHNFLPALNMRYPQQLVEDAKMWDGEYDDVIGSRGDTTRGIPADRKLEAFNRLLENADAFAEWADAEFETP